jgi:hypothetical protein
MLSPGAIAGVVIGPILAISILFVLVFLLHRRKRRAQVAPDVGPQSGHQGASYSPGSWVHVQSQGTVADPNIVQLPTHGGSYYPGLPHNHGGSFSLHAPAQRINVDAQPIAYHQQQEPQELVNFGSMQVKGVRDIRGARERELGV